MPLDIFALRKKPLQYPLPLAEYNEDLFMGNTTIARIAGTGKVMLKMTSDKVLTLNNVLHVPTIRKNLVSTELLVKNGLSVS